MEQMEEILKFMKCVPRLLALLATKSSGISNSSPPSVSTPQETLKDAVQSAISSVNDSILLYMSEHKDLVAWDGESKLLMASSHQLPITVFGMDKLVLNAWFLSGLLLSI